MDAIDIKVSLEEFNLLESLIALEDRFADAALLDKGILHLDLHLRSGNIVRLFVGDGCES